MLKIKSYFIFVIAVLMISPGAAFAQSNTDPANRKSDIQKSLTKDARQAKQRLMVTPQEVNLGTVTFDKPGETVLTLKNAGQDIIDWSVECPDGWKKTESRKLSGSLNNKSDSIRLGIRLLPKEAEEKQKNKSGLAEMKLEAGGEKLICRKEFGAGTYRETVKINSSDGQKAVSVVFTIGYVQKNPLVNLNPVRLDMGNVLTGKTVSKKIILSNGGKEMLTWSVAMRKHQKDETADNLQQGRYLSFVNEETRGSGIYTIPANLRETIEVAGRWTESDGYPSSAEGETFIKINFSGRGIVLYLVNYQDNEFNVTVSIDKNPVENVELFKNIEENKGELLLAENLIDGPHSLTIAGKNSRLVLEGIKILGGTSAFFPEGSIKILPSSGAITRQTNYLTVSLNTGQMTPGYYADDIVFNTNSGEAVVKIFAEVLPDSMAKVVDIYRYYNGTDYLFTADPQAETRRLIQNNYMKEGIAFRLFKADTPGTVIFYRWYNPQRRSHFYHYDTAGGGKDLRGYIYEGTIGNIATSKLTNTRELYRWYNPKTGHYFYSTDIQGGKINKKEYRFDGIAGYVK